MSRLCFRTVAGFPVGTPKNVNMYPAISSRISRKESFPRLRCLPLTVRPSCCVVRQYHGTASKEEDVPPRPMRDLSGRVAIVTGAGSKGNGLGNGRAAAILLAEVGATVLCVDKIQERADKTAAMIWAEGKGQAASFDADVSDERDCERAAREAVNRFGRLDILVNVVGVHGAKGTAAEVDIDAWRQDMDTNVTSMVMMAKHAIPQMRRNELSRWGTRGAIVNMASVAGLQGGTPSLLYPTSKGTVINMTRAMAAHHAGDGIRVNCVCPGVLYTPMVYGPGMSPEMRKGRKNRSLLRTEGYAWDSAAAIRFLVTDEARWITGSTLTVDAGATASVSVATASSAIFH